MICKSIRTSYLGLFVLVWGCSDAGDTSIAETCTSTIQSNISHSSANLSISSLDDKYKIAGIYSPIIVRLNTYKTGLAFESQPTSLTQITTYNVQTSASATKFYSIIMLQELQTALDHIFVLMNTL